MSVYADIRDKKNELIRRAKDGSVFVADTTVSVPAALTTGSSALLTALDPTHWTDLGWFSTDGVTFDRSTDSVDTSSFGSTEATRSDVTKDAISMSVTAQETKALTLGITTGAAIASIIGLVTTGEVIISKPTRPVLRYYRVLGIFLDHNDAGDEIYFGRLMPRAQVSDFGSQGYNEDETGISYPMTFQGKEDSTLGYSHRWYFAGPGWKSLLSDMGVPQGT
jgi:hypothetical protein